MAERLLVTGGAGFIGSHVCEDLADHGHQIWLLDNFDQQYSASLKRRNITDLVDRDSVHLVEGDVRDTVLVAGLLADVPFDAVVHLAGRAGHRSAADDPDACYEVNTRGTLRLLEAMSRNAVRRLVLASSTSVYGEGEPPFTEEDAADRPTDPVGASKRAAELVVHVYHASHGLSAHCLRISAVYGPRQAPDRELRRLARLLEQGQQPNGDVTSRRDYVYVNDVAEAVRLSAERLLTEEKTVFETLNISGLECLSRRQLVSRLATALRPDSPPKSARENNGRERAAHASGEKAWKVLGFEPRVSLDDGLREFVRWLRQEPERTNGAPPSAVESLSSSPPGGGT